MMKYLGNAIIERVQRRQKRRTRNHCAEQRRLRVPAVGQQMERDGACTSGLTPERHLCGISTEAFDLIRIIDKLARVKPR